MNKWLIFDCECTRARARAAPFPSFLSVTFHNHLRCTQCQNRRPTKCTMYNTMCSGQTPSLNLTRRTSSKNRINWNKPCTVFFFPFFRTRMLCMQMREGKEEEQPMLGEAMAWINEWRSLTFSFFLNCFVMIKKKKQTNNKRVPVMLADCTTARVSGGGGRKWQGRRCAL